MLSRWPIRNKLLFGIALLLVIVVTMSISSFQGTYAYRELVRSLSSRATELPLATDLLSQVGDLRVTLGELQAHASRLDLLPYSPTCDRLSEDFKQKFGGVRKLVEDYRDLLEQHDRAEFRIADASREWKKLGEIEECLAKIEELTRNPVPPAKEAGDEPEDAAREQPSAEASAEPSAAAVAENAVDDRGEDSTENETEPGESVARAGDEGDAAEANEKEPSAAEIYLGPRYDYPKVKSRPALWYYDPIRVSNLAHDDLVRLQNYTRELPSYLQGHMYALAGDVRSRYRAWILLTWFCAVAATALTVLFIVLIYRWVFRPLRCLVKGSRRVASGDFNYQIELASRDEMGELAGAMNDMTTRFRTIRDDLDRQVQLRTKQVVRSEQLASVGFLAAGVAHEINNPLASIAMCAESLEGRLLEAIPQQSEQSELVSRYLKMIQTEAFRCKGITEKLLDFSRVGEVKRQSADLRELVQTVIEMVRHLGKYQDRKIELSEGEPVIALVNVQEIKQVVLNLVTNALDSVDADGKLTIELGRSGGFAEMTFTDNGCGMTEEVQKHLFEPFFTRKRGGQGTGLGLSIVYRIVSDHGGQIEAASAGLGCGSQFHVTLPLAETGQQKSTQAFVHKENSHRYQAA